MDRIRFDATFRQYHNPDKMGRFRPAKTFGIVTDKHAGLEEGDIVWLATGEDRPRRYFLCETFVVERIAPQSAGRYKYRMSGEDGKSLYPRKIDKASPWFQKLLMVTGNFRFGLQPISNEEIIRNLQKASADDRSNNS